MLPRKISESDQFSYVLDSDDRGWQILLLLWVSYPYSYLTQCISPWRSWKSQRVTFPFNHSRSMRANLSQWGIKSNLLLDFRQVSPPLCILKRDKRRKGKEREMLPFLPLIYMWYLEKQQPSSNLKNKKSTCWGWQSWNMKSTWILNDIIMSLS